MASTSTSSARRLQEPDWLELECEHDFLSVDGRSSLLPPPPPHSPSPSCTSPPQRLPSPSATTPDPLPLPRRSQVLRHTRAQRAGRHLAELDLRCLRGRSEWLQDVHHARPPLVATLAAALAAAALAAAAAAALTTAAAGTIDPDEHRSLRD